MEWLGSVDWYGVFAPGMPFLEIFVRASLVYLGLFFILRMLLTRQAGALGTSDLLVIVLLADASQNGMAHEYSSLADGLVLVLTLVFWNYVLEWMGYHFKWFEPIVHPRSLPLIERGRINRRNMQRELISRAELMTQLREQGVEKISDVKRACLEGDGRISVVRFDKGEGNSQKDMRI